MPDQEPNQQANAAWSKLFTMIKNCCDFLKRKFDTIAWVLGVAAAIIAGIWLILSPRVDEAVTRESVLENISSRLRPYAVIDARLNNSSATFEYDEHGTFADIIDSVDFREGEPNLSGILTFKMKRFVQLPLIRPLTSGVYVHSFWRTNKFDWAFEIRPNFTTEKLNGVDTGSIEQLSAEKNYRFLVELLIK
jgi:NADH dehydrogenase FAD-containing subunit